MRLETRKLEEPRPSCCKLRSSCKEEEEEEEERSLILDLKRRARLAVAWSRQGFPNVANIRVSEGRSFRL